MRDYSSSAGNNGKQDSSTSHPAVKQATVEDANRDDSKKTALVNQSAMDLQSPMVWAFANLELFVSTFPGQIQVEENELVTGFSELKETFIRTLQFFWPVDQLKVTAILDASTYSNNKERDDLKTTLRSLFMDDTASVNVEVQFNPRTNVSLFGTGWYIQQLVMLWADNFTDAEYIGFVDDNTVISSAVQPCDIFDEKGRTRVIARAAEESANKEWIESTDFSFKRKSRVYAMTYFPVVVKRKHLAMMRDEIMSIHPEYATFDDFFSALVHRGKDKKKLVQLSQFCLVMDYLYDSHRDEYAWHFETGRGIEYATEEMYDPFPRIAIHGSYLFMGVKRLRAARTLAGRRKEISKIMKEGYCYSLPSWNNAELNAQRCSKCHVSIENHIRGEWKFEQYNSFWTGDETKLSLAHDQRREKRRADHLWNETEVIDLFGT